MKLTDPIIITPRLLPGVRVGDAWISVEHAGATDYAGRGRIRYYIDGPGFEYENEDLSLPIRVAHTGLQEALENLLGFIGAAGEAYRYTQSTGRASENLDLFPSAVNEWAYQHSDEIDMLRLEIEETPNLITA